MRILAVIVTLGGLLTNCGFGQETLDISQALARRIIDPQLPLSEVQDYVSQRVAPVPRFETAAEWETWANRQRQETLNNVVFRGEAAAWRDAPVEVEWLDTIETKGGYRIRKLRYTALPGLWIPALLYEPDTLEGKVPVNLAVNGHDPAGKAAPYKQIRCINMAKRGMLVLNVEWYGMGQLRQDDFGHYKMNQLDLCGTSGLAPFLLAMTKGIDVLLAHPSADNTRVSVSGLSGGGWQTITVSALDPRVTLCNPVAGYSSIRTRARYAQDLGDSEQTPVDLAAVADYATLTAMLAPRPALLTFNGNDQCCFKAEHALPPLVEAARPVYELFGRANNLRTHVNHDPGTHNFELENREAFYRMLGDHFFAGKAFDPKEIPCEDEVRTPEDIQVALPTNTPVTFHSLAMDLARDLPKNPELPTDRATADQWIANRRKELATVTRYRHEAVQAIAEGTPQAIEGGVATGWWLRVGGSWTVPATEFLPTESTEGPPLLILADNGRATISPASIRQALGKKMRVLAIDPFYLGESKITERDFLHALQVSCIGDRPLGVQATQIAAVARWLAASSGSPSVNVVAIGPRTSLASLVAAAVEPDVIGTLEVQQSLPSLKQVLEQNLAVNQIPEYFCFGLLHDFDITQIAALSAPRRLTFVSPAGAMNQTVAPLIPWFQLHNAAQPFVVNLTE